MPALAEPPAAPASAPIDHEAVFNAAFKIAAEGNDPIENPPVLTPKAPEPPKEEPKKEEPAAPIEKKEEPKAPEEEVDPLDKPPEGTAPLPAPNPKELRTRLKHLEATLKKTEEEKAAFEEERAAWQEEKQKLEKRLSEDRPAPEKIDYNEEPSVKPHREKILNDLTSTSLALGREPGKILKAKFSEYLLEYLAASQTQDEAKMDALIERVETELGEESRRETMSLLGRSSPEYQQYVQEIKKLQDDSHNRLARKSLEKYTATEQKINAVLEPLGQLPEEVIAAQPYATESFVSKLLTDPKWAVRSAEAKKEIREVLAGLKPLSPEEQAKLEANDTGNLTQVEAARTQKYEKRQAALVKRAYLGTLLNAAFPALLEELETLRASKAEEDSEGAALEKVPAVSGPAPKKPAEVDPNKLIDDAFAMK